MYEGDLNELYKTYEKGARRSRRNESTNSTSGYRFRLGNSRYTSQLNNFAPQAIIKVVSHLNGNDVKRVMDYIARTENSPGKTDYENSLDLGDFKSTNNNLTFERSNGIQLRGPKDVKAVFEEWKGTFADSKRADQKARHATHFIMSAGVDISLMSDKEKLQTSLKVVSAARDVLHEQLDKYDYVFTLHTDTNHPHIHVVANTNAMEKGVSKLRLNQPELFDLRFAFADKMSALGLEHKSTLKRDLLLIKSKKEVGRMLNDNNDWLVNHIKSKNSGDSINKVETQWKAYLRLKRELEKKWKYGAIDRTLAKVELKRMRHIILNETDVEQRKAVISESLKKLDRQIQGLDRAYKGSLVNPAAHSATKVLRRRKTLDYMEKRLDWEIALVKEAINEMPIKRKDKQTFHERLNKQSNDTRGKQ